MLVKLNHEVETAEDGQAGVDYLAGHPEVEVVLMDWNMPVLDGYAALQAIRANPGHAAVKVVMMTTENTTDKIQDALSAGANEYIMKPFNEEILSDKLSGLAGGDFL